MLLYFIIVYIISVLINIIYINILGYCVKQVMTDPGAEMTIRISAYNMIGVIDYVRYIIELLPLLNTFVAIMAIL